MWAGFWHTLIFPTYFWSGRFWPYFRWATAVQTSAPWSEASKESTTWGEISSVPAKWVSPTGHSDPDSNWTNEINAYDDDTDTYTTGKTGTTGYTKFLEFLYSGGMLCSKLRFYARVRAAPYYDIDLDAYYNGDWHNVYEGEFTTLTWIIKDLPEMATVTKARIRFNKGSALSSRIHDFDFGEVSSWSQTSKLSTTWSKTSKQSTTWS